MTQGGKVTGDSLIGDVIEKYPETMEIIEKYFGKGCFTCPGIRMESISFGAMMHNADQEAIVREINERIGA